MVQIPSTLQKCGLCGEPCWSAADSACSKAQVRRVPFRKRRSLIPVQRESVNSSRPEFLPMVLPVRAPDRDQGSQSRIVKPHFLRVCCSIAASCHLPLHLSPPDGLHIEATLASATIKLLHAVDVLCIDYYGACQRKKRANSWNDCHSRVEVSRQQAQKKICWDSVHTRFG
jgi:hypothetical protein